MLPPALASLEKLAWNLWWSWHPEAVALWHQVDELRWENHDHNPIALIADVEPERWTELAGDQDFMSRVDKVVSAFEAEMADPGWCGRKHPNAARVAYFSMEFGLHESVRTYSGGLGVLAGDHLKSASDLNVPLVAVSLFYQRGYFTQVIDRGRQLAAYPHSQPSRLPIRPIVQADGSPLTIEVEIGRSVAIAKVMLLHVGRTRLYLLDTDHGANPPAIRQLTRSLYGGDERTRIRQEALLGIGGMRALRALGEDFDVVHLNEGHCAFAAVELLREQTEDGTLWQDAIEHVRARCVFTTHTPVPAGHDRFDFALVDETLGPWRDKAKWMKGTLMDLGRERPEDWDAPLVMTVLALRLTRAANGVSKRHGEVSREMWHHLYPSAEVDEVPIGHITNGVHPTTWMSGEAQALFDSHVPNWRAAPWDADRWERGLATLTDAQLWDLRNSLRARLVDFVSRRCGVKLSTEKLTIGFARRFATYKRGNLLFTDPERLRKILDHGPGVQILFSGKAHPRDIPGQQVLADIIRWSEHRSFRGRVVFIEDYDMAVGAALTSGVDVWLNNPRRPKEASGTSGQKVTLNAGLNLSVLDGWWMEGYDETNGWAIGGTEVVDDIEEMDRSDAEALYTALEKQVLPLWTERCKLEIPRGWIERVRRSTITCASEFNSHRMVRDYVEELYGDKP